MQEQREDTTLGISRITHEEFKKQKIKMMSFLEEEINDNYFLAILLKYFSENINEYLDMIENIKKAIKESNKNETL